VTPLLKAAASYSRSVTLDDRDATSSAEVVILGGQNPDVSVRLLDRRFVDEHETVFTIEATPTRDSMHAST
jgi:hypothetical protein